MTTNITSKRIWITVMAAAAAGAAGIAYATAGGEPRQAAAAVTPAEPAKAPQQHPADALPNKLIGLPVVAAGGETVGQVLRYGPGGTGKTLAFDVKVVSDLGAEGSTVQIPEDRTVVNGSAIQLSLTFDDVKRMMPN